MISGIEGDIQSFGDGYVDVSIGGITFRVNIPNGLISDSETIGTSVSLSTSLQIRQDSLSIYGFNSSAMRDFFETLITINGVQKTDSAAQDARTNQRSIQHYHHGSC